MANKKILIVITVLIVFIIFILGGLFYYLNSSVNINTRVKNGNMKFIINLPKYFSLFHNYDLVLNIKNQNKVISRTISREIIKDNKIITIVFPDYDLDYPENTMLIWEVMGESNRRKFGEGVFVIQVPYLNLTFASAECLDNGDIELSMGPEREEYFDIKEVNILIVDENNFLLKEIIGVDFNKYLTYGPRVLSSEEPSFFSIPNICDDIWEKISPMDSYPSSNILLEFQKPNISVSFPLNRVYATGIQVNKLECKDNEILVEFENIGNVPINLSKVQIFPIIYMEGERAYYARKYPPEEEYIEWLSGFDLTPYLLKGSLNKRGDKALFRITNFPPRYYPSEYPILNFYFPENKPSFGKDAPCEFSNQ